MPLYNPSADISSLATTSAMTTALALKADASSISLLNDNLLLWSLIGANMNVTTDQALTKAFAFTNYIIDRILFTNASASLTLAAGGIYTAASKGGTAVVAAAQIYSGLTGSGIVLPLTIANSDLRTGAALYLSLTTAQGGAATADVRVFGMALS